MGKHKQPRLVETPTIRTLGLDPSLRHGILLEAEWSFAGDTPQLLSSHVLVDWSTPPRKRGILHVDVSVPEIQTFCNWIISEVRKHEVSGMPIGVDWHPMSVFWGSRKAGVKLTFMMGYLCRALETLGIPVVFMDPGHVRQAFGLPARTKKEDIWEEVAFLPDSADSDERDALILSYLVAEALRD